MASAPRSAFWQFDAGHWMQELNSSEKGLSTSTANQLLLQQGLQAKSSSPLLKDARLFIGQFKSPLMLLLIGAVILSAFLGDTSDVFIILFIVLSTGIMSFLQERNAGRVVEKLQSLVALKCNVIRDGQEMEIEARKVVPGDILVFNAGDMIPADCLVIEANELHANESSLTGESYPVRKDPGKLEEKTELAKRINCLWEGTNIVSGHGKAIAINVGANTIFGSLAKSAGTSVETSFEKGIKEFGYFLMRITLVLAIVILVINLLNHKSVIDSALFALALAVGMAPELLPAIATIAMSAGARRMLEKKVIVKRLASIQNLGAINLLCTDKTGTITEGVIQVTSMVNGEGSEDPLVKEIAYWNAKFETGYANPIDDALRQLSFVPQWKAVKIGEVPYDFIRKRLSIAIQTDEKKLLLTKGAFTELQTVCSRIQMKDGTTKDIAGYRTELGKAYEQYGQKGLRCIAVAFKELDKDAISKEDEKDLVFAGFLLLEDPVKGDIKETLAQLSQLQVGLKIITGDNKNVALSIALQLGIADPKVITGAELLSTSPEALVKLAQDTHIFAEVEPQQKERIIQALRKTFTVAYMGDGINDVSAINAADVGISVNNAVDVAKEAADFVLMEKTLMVLVDGIREGRKTFANTLKYIFINTGSTFGNMFSVAIASFVLPFLPMLPKQILLTNFITDFPYLAVASDNVDATQLERPGKWNLKMIRNYMVIFGIHSSLFDVITFMMLLFVLKVKESAFQTGWFIESVLTELFILFIIRTRKNFFRSKPGKYLVILSLAGLVITLGLPYLPIAAKAGLTPLPLLNLGVMLGIVFLYVITGDLLKIWFFRRKGN